MTNNSEFRAQMQQLGNLVAQLDMLPSGSQRTAGKEFVERLMEIHAAALEQMLNIILETSEAGPETIDRLGKDPIVGGLLLLYSLHPEDLETRVSKAMESLRPRLHKFGCHAVLLSVSDNGAVSVEIAKAGHGCGSSAKDLTTMVEDTIYEFAPDVTLLEIVGPDEQGAAGIAALENLIGRAHVAAGSNAPMLRSEGAD